MLLAGCAMPFHVESEALSQLHTSEAGPSQTTARRVVFYNDAFEHAIRNNVIDVVLNHSRDQELGSTRNGLFLFTTRAGLFFYLRLPRNALAQLVGEAVVAGKIRHICACSDWTESEEEGDRVVVRRANLQSLSLLITAPAHQQQTWIMLAGPEAEARIDEETAAASKSQLWALNPAVSASEATDAPTGIVSGETKP